MWSSISPSSLVLMMWLAACSSREPEITIDATRTSAAIGFAISVGSSAAALGGPHDVFVPETGGNSSTVGVYVEDGSGPLVMELASTGPSPKCFLVTVMPEDLPLSFAYDLPDGMPDCPTCDVVPCPGGI
jgi:hypothetical protein